MAETSNVVMREVGLRLGKQDFHFGHRFPAGTITAVTGPSGGGKSTLLNLIAGFETPAEGTISIAGKDVSRRHPSQRPLSFVFQDNNLFAHLDVATNVGLGVHPSLKLSAADRHCVARALADVGLEGFDKRLPATLSGGERQRAAFARALVRDKPVLLLDEPFASLDPNLRREMADLLSALHRRSQATVIIVSHDPDEVRRLADEIVFVDQGRIIDRASKGDFPVKWNPAGLGRFFSS